MLNWIAIWVGAYLFALNGPLQNSDPAQQSVPVSNDVAASAKLPGLLGRPGAAGPAHRDLHRARGGRRLLGHPQPLDHRLRGAGGRPEPRGGALRRHQRRAQLHPGHGRVRRLRRAGGRRWTSSAGSSTSPPTTSSISASVGLGFFGIAVALLGRNTASGTAVAALLFGALLSGTSQRNLDPTIFEPELAGEPDAHHPGPRRAHRQRRRDRADDAAPRARGLSAAHGPAGARRARRGGRGRVSTAVATAAPRRGLRAAPRGLGRHRAGLRRVVHRAAAGAGAHAGRRRSSSACWP